MRPSSGAWTMSGCRPLSAVRGERRRADAGAEAFTADPADHHTERAGRLLHGLRVRMYTNKLGFCFATAGPGAFNLFSGLAVAMSTPTRSWPSRDMRPGNGRDGARSTRPRA